MTEKRGTGTDYGQEKLKQRSEESSELNETIQAKKKVGFKKIAVIALVSAVGVGSLYPVFFGGNGTPKERTDEVVAIDSKGTLIENGDSAKATADKQADDQAVAAQLAAEKSAAEKEAIKKAEAEKLAAEKKAKEEKERLDKADQERRDSEARAAAIAESEKAGKDHSETGNAIVAGGLSGAASGKSSDAVSGAVPAADDNASVPAVGNPNAESEAKLIELAAPASPSADTPPATQVVSTTTSKLPASDEKGIAAAVVNDPTVKATDEAKAQARDIVANSDQPKPFDASKFGLDEQPANAANEAGEPHNRIPQGYAPQQQQVSQLERLQRMQQLERNRKPNPGSVDVLKNYTGQSQEVEYGVQQQHTIFLYDDTFAAKVYLLPLEKGVKINAYLTDSQGWTVSQLPGNILRISRSANRSKWTDATDLFLIAGKRTYTLILQAVDQPVLRTDTLRFVEPKTASVKTAKK